MTENIWHLKIALNQNTCEGLDLVKFIDYSKDFDGIELDFDKIAEFLSKNNHLSDLLEILGTYSLEIESIFKLDDFILSSEHYFKRTAKKKLEKMINHCYQLESDLIIINPRFLEDPQEVESIERWKIMRKIHDRLKKIAKLAYKSDINLGLEFINSSNSIIQTLKDAKEAMENLEDLENLGYVIDVYHFASNQTDLNQLEDIKDVLFLVQLCDIDQEAKEDPQKEANPDRLFIGEGNYNLKNFINFTQKIGYRRTYSLEIDKENDINDLYLKTDQILNDFISENVS